MLNMPIRHSHQKPHYKYFRVFGCQSEYEGTADKKRYSDRSDKNRTLKFLHEVQTMINNDPCKSIRSTAKDIDVSEFLIR